jgi:lipopolysaccharide/colanic/teichoic acid biosynthesis glycosyltransferase
MIATIHTDSIPAGNLSPQENVRFERLEAVESEDLLEQSLALSTIAPPPRWLTPLNLSQARTDLRCLRARTRIAKRLIDLAVASAMLVMAIPIVLVAALIIKLTSRGPVLFTQIRVGLNTRRTTQRVEPLTMECRRRQASYGRPFKIYKLRTMYVDADSNGPRQVSAGDKRLIPFGKFLRKMRIDELPQLINVLRGEMSMVGPRPECIEYMEELSAKVPNYLQRLGLKPGLTGIAQIEAGYANDLKSYRRKVAFDLLYLQNCCLWNDIKILVRTVKVVLTGFGAL